MEAEQEVGHGGEPEAQLVGPEPGAQDAVGQEIELAFFEAVTISLRAQ